jgi:hypothetical protein
MSCLMTAVSVCRDGRFPKADSMWWIPKHERVERTNEGRQPPPNENEIEMQVRTVVSFLLLAVDMAYVRVVACSFNYYGR